MWCNLIEGHKIGILRPIRTEVALFLQLNVYALYMSKLERKKKNKNKKTKQKQTLDRIENLSVNSLFRHN